MGHYDALIAAWNGTTQPPTGVTGTGLTPAMTTDEKIVAVNGWTMTGAIPTTYYTTGNDLLNCIDYAEFKALTATQQSNVMNMVEVPGPLLSGTANTTHMVPGLFLDLFPAGSKTRTAMIALAKALVAPWWQVTVDKGGGGLTSPVSKADCAACVPPLV
jgi:hypothetical protein